MATVDWQAIADLVCQILTRTYVDQRRRFEQEAARRGITREQLVAAAITEYIREHLPKPPASGKIGTA